MHDGDTVTRHTQDIFRFAKLQLHTKLSMKLSLALSLAGVAALANGELILDEEFNELDITMWQPEITLGGGGNWEAEAYFVRCCFKTVMVLTTYTHRTTAPLLM